MFDNSPSMGYNDTHTNDINERLVDNYLSRPHIVKMDEQRPLNDPDCEHSLVKDDDDAIEETQAWICQKCGVGMITKNKNTT